MSSSKSSTSRVAASLLYDDTHALTRPPMRVLGSPPEHMHATCPCKSHHGGRFCLQARRIDFVLDTENKAATIILFAELFRAGRSAPAFCQLGTASPNRVVRQIPSLVAVGCNFRRNDDSYWRVVGFFIIHRKKILFAMNTLRVYTPLNMKTQKKGL